MMVQKAIHITTLLLVFAALIFTIFRNSVNLQSTDYLKRYTTEDLTYFSDASNLSRRKFIEAMKGI